MLTVVLASILQEYRARRIARFAPWVLAYGVALWVVERFGGGVPALLWFFFWVPFLLVIAYYLIRLGGIVKQRVLWRLRRRLIVTYIFIAVVPILLIVTLVALKEFMTSGQFAAFLVVLKLRDRADGLEQLTRVVGHEARHSLARTPEALTEQIERFVVTELGEHAASYPGLEISLQVGRLTRGFRLQGKPPAKLLTLPAWLDREEFAGIVIDHDQIALRAVNRGPTPVGELTLILSQPFTPEMLDLVGEGIGPVEVLTTRAARLAARFQGSKPDFRFESSERSFVATVRSQSLRVPEPTGRLDSAVLGASTLDPIIWGGEKETRLAEPVFVVVTSRMSTLNRQLLATLGRFSRFYVNAFVVVAVVFLVIELFALVIGIQLTRSITTTVDKLHDATERVRAGDFSYRINLSARDQLSSLGEAFDTMTASVERLLLESQEKLRLESELEIAREVQNQLFPRAAPEVVGLQLYGVCKPARTVSGDYYDFLRLGQNRVGLVVGDVSGKGISAALLMASIQSALHAQFYDGFSPAGASRATPVSTAEVVDRLNRQLFESTPMEKYATFFYAVYDGATRKLTYTNAGHPAPILFHRGTCERLEAGGTVLGLLSPVKYEQAEVELEAGDLLLAFTDGISEPENIFGEEFGEAALLELARRALGSSPEVLAEEIYRRVTDWTGSPELQDDMTLLVAKAVA